MTGRSTEIRTRRANSWTVTVWLGGLTIIVPSPITTLAQTGACCDDASQSCVEEVELGACAGRYGGDGSTCHALSPVCACEAADPCPACTEKTDNDRRRVEVKLVDVVSVGLSKTYTYSICRDSASQQLSHWVLGLSDECCANLVGTSGGESSGVCQTDPTTGLFGLKFNTPGGVPACSSTKCGETDDVGGPALFSVTLGSGDVVTGCVKTANKIADATFVPFGCLQGPDCGACARATEICFGISPECDDCNINGVPDVCDLAQGNLTDSDGDGVPDECIDQVGSSGNWSDDIWGLSGDNPYPDNLFGTPNLHVTLEGGMIFLDITAEIETLRLFSLGTLLMTQDLRGDLTVLKPGGVWNEGTIEVQGDRTLSVPLGPFVLGSGGVFQASGDATGPVSGVVTADRIILLPTICGLEDQMTLSSFMSAITTGDFIMDGRGASCGLRSGSGGGIAGGQTPPVLEVKRAIPASHGSIAGLTEPEFVRIKAGGSFRLIQSAELCIGCDTVEGTTPPLIKIGGDFDNRSLYPSLFDWLGGVLILEGPGPQVFEIGGMDLGGNLEGFGTDVDAISDTRFHSNFAMGSVVVGSTSQTLFANAFPNTAGIGACDEALYVDELRFAAGAEVTLDNIRIYYKHLIDEGAAIHLVGCAELVDLCDPDPPTQESIAKNRYITLESTGSIGPIAVRVLFKSLPTPFDVLNGSSMWVGPTVIVGANNGSQLPIEGFDTFLAAPVQCEPFFFDATGIRSISIFGEYIVPEGVYELQTLSEGCSPTLEESLSTPLRTTMSVFGDVVGLYANGRWTGPDGSVNIVTDATSLVDAFANLSTAPVKSRVDLWPTVPDQIVDVVDLTAVVDAFRGQPYPFSPTPWPCPQ